MVYLLKFSSETGKCLGSTDVWIESPPPDWYVPPISNGGLIEEWMRDAFPKIVSVDPNDYDLKDFVIAAGGMYFVSPKIKKLIEQVEPDTHQFWEIKLQYGDIVHQYFLFRCATLEDYFDLQASDVAWREVAGLKRKLWNKKPTIPVVLKKELIANKHFWMSKNGRYLLLSDELYELFQKENVSGVEYEKQIVK